MQQHCGIKLFRWLLVSSFSTCSTRNYNRSILVISWLYSVCLSVALWCLTGIFFLFNLASLPWFGQRHEFSITSIPLHHLCTRYVLWKVSNWMHYFEDVQSDELGLNSVFSNIWLSARAEKPARYPATWNCSTLEILCSRETLVPPWGGLYLVSWCVPGKKAIICSAEFQRAFSVITVSLCHDQHPRPHFLKGLHFAVILNTVISLDNSLPNSFIYFQTDACSKKMN